MPSDKPKRDDEENINFDQLHGIYLLRYPFTVSSLNWGVAMGSLFGINSYLRHSKVIRKFEHSTVVWSKELLWLQFKHIRVLLLKTHVLHTQCRIIQ